MRPGTEAARRLYGHNLPMNRARCPNTKTKSQQLQPKFTESSEPDISPEYALPGLPRLATRQGSRRLLATPGDNASRRRQGRRRRPHSVSAGPCYEIAWHSATGLALPIRIRGPPSTHSESRATPVSQNVKTLVP
ncbi:hypothetical protein GCM10017557_07690 [Streptomyces aurantiacus]|uniref:Uncharacterized protein n=1 Tax=Streptomyces aurantiacus TaxID=47760 RepID=A0A7G1NW31_9ACTN|nr:hypothetical protein GCM10017557_07690 [Streptomyces aurantiacus]